MDILSNLKRTVSEPKIYAMVVKASRGQILHLGVHFSLDEAYSSARRHVEALNLGVPGEAMDIDLWSNLPAREVIAQFIEPSKIGELIAVLPGTPVEPVDAASSPQAFPTMTQITSVPPELLAAIATMDTTIKKTLNETSSLNDQIKDLKETKNRIMRKLIDEGDVVQVEKVKSLLGSYSVKYILKAIENKNISI